MDDKRRLVDALMNAMIMQYCVCNELFPELNFVVRCTLCTQPLVWPTFNALYPHLTVKCSVQCGQLHGPSPPIAVDKTTKRNFETRFNGISYIIGDMESPIGNTNPNKFPLPSLVLILVILSADIPGFNSLLYPE